MLCKNLNAEEFDLLTGTTPTNAFRPRYDHIHSTFPLYILITVIEKVATAEDVSFWRENSDAKAILARAAATAREAPKWSPLVKLPDRDPAVEARRTAYIAQSVADAEKLSYLLLEKRFSFKSSGTQIVGFEDFKSVSKAKQTVSEMSCCLCH